MRHVDEVLHDAALLDVALPGAGLPLEEQPHPRAPGHAGRCRGASAGAQAHAQLELRGARARGPGQPRLSPVHARGRGQGSRCQDAGQDWGWRWGPQIIEQIHQRVVAIAQERKVIAGRRMRVDTTVVETDIHYPTDASLLGDGVRVLTRTMKTHLGAGRRCRRNAAGPHPQHPALPDADRPGLTQPRRAGQSSACGSATGG